MKIALASDHAGFELKQFLIQELRSSGMELLDLGTHSNAAVDYPDFAEDVAQAVLTKKVERGILICGSGVGAAVAVNKIPGIRGGLCHDVYSAHQGVEHDDVNVLVLGARVIGTAVALELVQTFLKARYTNEERHRRRLAKVLAIEKRYLTEKPNGGSHE
jgi:ribose 5-phosphate isomerase B